MKGKKPVPAIERVLARISPEPTTGCWIFTGSLDRDGYGQITIGSRTNHSIRNSRVHTVAYKALVGPVPVGKVLDHKCRVRCCANPAHLEPVTAVENVLRGNTFVGINAAKTKCSRGHEFSGINLFTYLRNGKMRRRCRECSRIHDRATKARRRDSHQ